MALPYPAPCTMSSVPYVPPETIKKVAATSGHRVRRIDFLREPTGEVAGLSQAVECWLERLQLPIPMASSSERLTLTTASPLTFCSRLPGDCVFPGISAKLVRMCRLREFGRDARIFFEKRRFFSTRASMEVTGERTRTSNYGFHRGAQGKTRIHPCDRFAPEVLVIVKG